MDVFLKVARKTSIFVSNRGHLISISHITLKRTTHQGQQRQLYFGDACGGAGGPGVPAVQDAEPLALPYLAWDKPPQFTTHTIVD